jgi:selenoprotein W-related protein
VFEVRVGDEVIWSRKERGRFPDIKEIKQIVRDTIAPGRAPSSALVPMFNASWPI